MLPLLRLSAAALVMLTASSALALECPTPASFSDPANTEAVNRILPPSTDLSAPQAVQSAIFLLKEAGISNDQIIDQLVYTYCQQLSSQPGLTDEQKNEQIRTFSSEADRAVNDTTPN